MSRIGKQPILIPEKVKVTLDGNRLHAEGPNGKLDVVVDPLLEISIMDGKVLLKRRVESSQARARHGLFRNLVWNAIRGVSAGYKKELDIVGVGYRAEVKGNTLNMALGYSHPIEFSIPTGIKISIDKQTHLVLSGASSELVGETAARIRKLREPEPYKGKGIKYSDEVIQKKVGKQAVTSGGGK